MLREWELKYQPDSYRVPGQSGLCSREERERETGRETEGDRESKTKIESKTETERIDIYVVGNYKSFPQEK